MRSVNRFLGVLLVVVLINVLFAAITYAQTLPLPAQPIEYELVGDIMLPKSAIEGRSTFSATYWPNGIVPYSFHASVNSTNRNRTLAAMNGWSAVAGITFVERTSQANYIEIINSGAEGQPGGNWSNVGMVGGRQYLSMYNWESHYIIMHELAHALGVWHEQSRPDRDTYVTIQWGNITAGKEGNFAKYSWANTYGGYDFASIMHYDDYAFSSNGQRTIVARPGYESYQNTMGNMSYLTDNDKAGMRFIYPRLASFDSNLVSNSNFSGFSGWGSAFSTPYAIYTWNGGYSAVNYLGFKGASGQPMGAIYQNINQDVLAGDIVELRVMLGNPSPSTKHVRVHLHHYSPTDPWSDAAICDLYPPVGEHRLEHYVIRRKITTNWTNGMRIWVEVRPADNQPDVWMTSATVRRLPGSSLNLTGTQCFSPSNQTDWDFTTGPQGWRTGNAMTYGVQTGSGMQYGLTGNDAWLEGPSMVNISANNYRYIKVRMASTSTCAQMFFQEYGKIWFDGPRHVAITTNPDGQMRTYVFDMASNPLWTGNIGQLRLDTNCNSGYSGSNPNTTTIQRVWLSNSSLSNTANLLSNPSFESGLSPWVANNTTAVKRVAKKPNHGYYSTVFTRTTSALTLRQNVQTNAIVAGHTPVYGAWVSSSRTGIPFEFRMQYTLADGTRLKRFCLPTTSQLSHAFYGCYSTNLTQPLRSVKMTVYVGAGTGKLWMDNFTLYGDAGSGRRDGLSPDVERNKPSQTFRQP